MRLNSDLGWSKNTILTEVVSAWGFLTSVAGCLRVFLILSIYLFCYVEPPSEIGCFSTIVRNPFFVQPSSEFTQPPTVVRNPLLGGSALFFMPEKERNYGTATKIQK